MTLLSSCHSTIVNMSNSSEQKLMVEGCFSSDYYIYSTLRLTHLLESSAINPKQARRIPSIVFGHLLSKAKKKLDATGNEIYVVHYDETVDAFKKVALDEGLDLFAIQRFRVLEQINIVDKKALLILLSGCDSFTGYIATHIGKNLHIPNVLFTNILLDLSRDEQTNFLTNDRVVGNSSKNRTDSRDFVSYEKVEDVDDPIYPQESCTTKYRREAQVVRDAAEVSIQKCLTDVRSLMITGMHIDPCLYRDIFRSEPRVVVLPFILKMGNLDHMIWVQNMVMSNGDRDTNQSMEHITNKVGQVMKSYEKIEEYWLSCADMDSRCNIELVDGVEIEESANALHLRLLELVRSFLVDNNAELGL